MALAGGDGECGECAQRGLSRCFCKNANLVRPGAPGAASPSPQEGGLSTALSFRHKGAAQTEEANAVFLPEKVQQARAAAKLARDSRKEGERPLVDLWRDASKPRKDNKPSEAVPRQPAGCKLDFPDLFDQWLDARGLTDVLRREEEDRNGWAVYSYVKEPVVESGPEWEYAYHGTWWYAVWLILETGIFLESNDLSLGHDFWEPGVYCSPDLDTGLWYARPQILFGDGVYHRVILELKVDPAQRKKERKRGGVQWVFPCTGVALSAVLVRSNAPPAKGEERVNEWEPELEAVPCESLRPEATVNLRQEPWPPYIDPFPFDLGSTDVPPWMRNGTQKTSAGSAPAASQKGKGAVWPPSWEAGHWSSSEWQAAPPRWPTPAAAAAWQPPFSDLYGTHPLGGLYGRWLWESSPAAWGWDGAWGDQDAAHPAKRRKNGNGKAAGCAPSWQMPQPAAWSNTDYS